MADRYARGDQGGTEGDGLLNAARSAERELVQSLERAKADLLVVRGSTSWRITAPLRWLGRLIKQRDG